MKTIESMDWYKELTPEQEEQFEARWFLFSFSPTFITSDAAKLVAREAWNAAQQLAKGDAE